MDAPLPAATAARPTGSGPAAAWSAAAFVASCALLSSLPPCGSELWYDDVARLRDTTVSWPGLWTELPRVDNLKSPYLVGLHKAWTGLAGGDTAVAVRSWGAVLGAILAVQVFALARRCAGLAAGLVAGLLCATSSFWTRWSVEVHNYAPAAVALLGAWQVALARERLSLRAAAAVGALAGFAVGVFPGCAVALPGLLFVRSVRGSGWSAMAAMALAAAAVAAPAVLAIAGSARFFAPSSESGDPARLRTYYFNSRKTPVEVLVRMFGADLRQGGFQRIHLGLLSLAALLLAAKAWAERRSSRAAAGALVAGTVTTLLVAWAASRPGRPFFYDRYVAAILATAPAAWVVACWPRGDVAGIAPRLLGAAAGLLLLVPWASGLAARHRAGDRWPVEVTSRSYTVAEALRSLPAGAPPEIYVHGEIVWTFLRLRAPDVERSSAGVFHLAGTRWADAAASGDRSGVAIEHAYGWPHEVTRLAGDVRTRTAADVVAAVRAGRRVVIAFDRTIPSPTWFRSEDERDGGLADVYAGTRDPGAAVLRFLGAPDVAVSSVVSTPQGRAVVVSLTAR